MSKKTSQLTEIAAADVKPEMYTAIVDPTEPVAANRNKRIRNNLLGSVNYSGNRTLLSTDAGKKLRSTGATDHTVTVPLNDDVEFPLGTVIFFKVIGTGLPSIAAAVGVTLNGPDLAFTDQYQDGFIHKVDVDEWDITIGGASGSAGDTTAPTVTSMEAVDAHTIVATFSEEITGDTGFSFTSAGPLTVNSVNQTAPNELTFDIDETMTSAEDLGWDYTPGDIEDTSANAMIAAGGSVTNSISYDSDAELYFTNQNVTATGDKNAVNTAIVDTKDLGFWTDLKFGHAFLGDTRVLNFKNPLNTDGAFRLTQAVGSAATLNATGAVFDGIDDALNTHAIHSVDFVVNEFTFVIGITALASNGTSRAFFGARDGSFQVHAYAENSGNLNYAVGNASDVNTSDNISVPAILVITLRDNGDGTGTYRMLLNNAEIHSQLISIPPGLSLVTTWEMYLGAGNSVGSTWLPAPCTIDQFWGFAKGATDPEMASLHSIASALRTGLGR